MVSYSYNPGNQEAETGWSQVVRISRTAHQDEKHTYIHACAL